MILYTIFFISNLELWSDLKFFSQNVDQKFFQIIFVIIRRENKIIAVFFSAGSISFGLIASFSFFYRAQSTTHAK